jgi:putative flippase GtrA
MRKIILATQAVFNLREVLLYSAVSAAGFAFDYSVLWLLTSQLNIHYLLATGIAFLVGGVVVYALSLQFVFKYRRIRNFAAESSSFIALGLVGLALNAAIVALGVAEFHLPVLIAKLGASALTLLVNYVLRKIALFAPLHTKAAH